MNYRNNIEICRKPHTYSKTYSFIFSESFVKLCLSTLCDFIVKAKFNKKTSRKHLTSAGKFVFNMFFHSIIH